MSAIVHAFSVMGARVGNESGYPRLDESEFWPSFEFGHGITAR